MNLSPTPILYVADVLASAAFFEQLLGRAPVEKSPGFAMFAFEGGGTLGLWCRPHVMPAVTAGPGGSELAWAVPDRAAVERLHAQWRGQGVTIVQAPTAMDFGYTFTAQDPEGHRLRVFTPEGA